jgi:RimJ/RimL family protein N-acetyltransferase
LIDYGYGVFLDALRPEENEQRRKWRNDPRIRKWCRQYSLISAKDQLRWFESQNDDASVAMFEIRVPGNHVGTCGLTSIDLVNSRAEFSLYIGPEHQGNGYAKAALLTLFRHGFSDLGLNRIWGESFAGNPAMGLFEKLGMEKEGIRREHYFRDGRFVDCTLYSIAASDFMARHQTLQFSSTPRTAEAVV